MARTYTRIQLEVWANRDFLELTPGAQWLYLHLVTTNTNNAGVLDWKPSRVALKALGATPSDVEEWALELVEANFIVIDRASEEVLIRTWI
ncbi:MAG: hypothetical protein WAS05_09240, partial [Candidatus Nanopelagicales bacterium]